MTMAVQAERHELGYFMSVVCFKAAVVGMEEALGEKAAAIAMIAAGRQRGKQLAEDLHLANQASQISLAEITDKLRYTIGKEGTRLCIVDNIEQHDDVFRVYTRETVCCHGEPEGSPRKCTYTLGAIQGFLEAYAGHRLRGQHVESVLRGSGHDVLEYTAL
ncbi:MAG: hypothetical protein WA939_13835 [Nodosilinea sp.]